MKTLSIKCIINNKIARDECIFWGVRKLAILGFCLERNVANIVSYGSNSRRTLVESILE